MNATDLLLVDALLDNKLDDDLLCSVCGGEMSSDDFFQWLWDTCWACCSEGVNNTHCYDCELAPILSILHG